MIGCPTRAWPLCFVAGGWKGLTFLSFFFYFSFYFWTLVLSFLNLWGLFSIGPPFVHQGSGLGFSRCPALRAVVGCILRHLKGKSTYTVPQPTSPGPSVGSGSKTLHESLCPVLTLNEKHVCYDSKLHFTPNLISFQFLALWLVQPALVVLKMWQIGADFLALSSFVGVAGPP